MMQFLIPSTVPFQVLLLTSFFHFSCICRKAATVDIIFHSGGTYMVYEKFLESIKLSVQQKLGTGLQVIIHPIVKNNGNVFDGLSIISPDSPFSPTVYLNAYYDEVERGLPLSVITEQIVLLYEEQNPLPEGLSKELGELDSVKDKIAYKVIGAPANTNLLPDVPHLIFLDLALVLYLVVSESADGQMTALIHNEHLKLWNVTKETLFTLADRNTPRMLPPRILSIENALMEISSHEDGGIIFPELPPIFLTVLTNQNGINGAAAMLYKDVLKNFAEQEKDDLLILPSSIHEVLLTPVKKALPYEELNTMVSLINHSDVPPEDRLSNHIYHYSREKDRITIPFERSKESKTTGPQ